LNRPYALIALLLAVMFIVLVVKAKHQYGSGANQQNAAGEQNTDGQQGVGENQSNGQQNTDGQNSRGELLANGTDAPEFTARDKNGNSVSLSSFRGKVVVLDFWATWCRPCQESLPNTEKVAEEFQDKGVVVLAVNVWDTNDAFLNWLPQHPEYKAINFVIDPSADDNQGIAKALYNVKGIPTQYVIDAQGKVAGSFVVGSREDLERAVSAALAGH
jgi:thiol-disulfide isomerase/thioredoxin